MRILHMFEGTFSLDAAYMTLEKFLNLCYQLLNQHVNASRIDVTLENIHVGWVYSNFYCFFYESLPYFNRCCLTGYSCSYLHANL